MRNLKELILLTLIPLAIYAQERTPKGAIITHDGYTVATSREDGSRLFPYKERLEPLLGYVNSKSEGIVGLSKSLDAQLNRGEDVQLSIDLDLQMRIEDILDGYKKTLDAQEVLAMVMQSDTGEMVAMASSNRYHPNAIKQKDIASLVSKYVRYPYEPGSSMQPLTLAIVLDKNRVEPDTAFDLNDGNLNIGHHMILTDTEIHQSLNATDIILNDSHIGIVQIAWLLTPKEFRTGLEMFGLTHLTSIELPNDEKGFVASEEKLKEITNAASTALGYGVLTTPLQLLKAYNVFINDGVSVTPTLLANKTSKYRRVISTQSAMKMHKILVENIHRCTGNNGQYDGLEIGGKTAMAYIFKDGKYRDEFHSSFYGFANDNEGHKYTIGVLVIRAKAEDTQMASRSAVPVFRKIVDVMVKEKYL